MTTVEPSIADIPALLEAVAKTQSSLCKLVINQESIIHNIGVYEG
jgi:hypothetical protein